MVDPQLFACGRGRHLLQLHELAARKSIEFVDPGRIGLRVGGNSDRYEVAVALRSHSARITNVLFLPNVGTTCGEISLFQSLS